MGIRGPFLIVVPLSTLGNWEREFEQWTDMNVIVYHGSAISRQVIQNYEFYYQKGDAKKRCLKFDTLITTYELVLSDVEVLKKFNFKACIIDEAHRLKNRNCKLLTGGGLFIFKLFMFFILNQSFTYFRASFFQDGVSCTFNWNAATKQYPRTLFTVKFSRTGSIFQFG